MSRILVALVLLASLALPGVASSEAREGTFIVRQKGIDHIRAADPIVSYGVFPSAHEHMFWCNSSTDEFSTLASLQAASSSCDLHSDKTAYWVPTLKDPNGATVMPFRTFTYYKNLPVAYSNTVPFPEGLKLVAGGTNYPNPKTFWDCFDNNPSGKFTTTIPRCVTDDLQVRLAFPNCWDGVSLDSADHRSHVVFPVQQMCPMTHPVKIPFLHYFVRWSPPAGGPGWTLSDGAILPHGDLFVASPLADLVTRCLNAGVNCGVVTG